MTEEKLIQYNLIRKCNHDWETEVCSDADCDNETKYCSKCDTYELCDGEQVQF